MQGVGRVVVVAVVWAGCVDSVVVGVDPPVHSPVQPGMARITDFPGGLYDIDRYEASAEPGVGDWGSDTADADHDGKVADPNLAAAYADSQQFIYDDDGGEDGFVATTVVAQSVPSVTPIGIASFYQAAAACMNAQKRLCTDAEWQWACQGGEHFNNYPDGHDWDGGDEAGLDCWTNDLTDGPQLTGTAVNCKTATLVYDQSGNVSEWTQRQTIDTANTYGGDYTITDPTKVTCSRPTPLAIGAGGPVTGFRCCKDAK